MENESAKRKLPTLSQLTALMDTSKTNRPVIDASKMLISPPPEDLLRKVC
jgi:hypothetical protein